MRHQVICACANMREAERRTPGTYTKRLQAVCLHGGGELVAGKKQRRPLEMFCSMRYFSKCSFLPVSWLSCAQTLQRTSHEVLPHLRHFLLHGVARRRQHNLARAAAHHSQATCIKATERSVAHVQSTDETHSKHVLCLSKLL